MKTILRYFKTNKWALIILLVLLLSKTLIQYFSFPTSWILTILRVLIFIIAIMLSFVIVKKLKYQIITLILVLLFSYGQGYINLWKISTARYIKSVMNKYEKEINSFIEREDYSSIMYQGENKIYDKDREGTLLASDYYSSFFKNTDFIQVEKNEDLILFVMYRFIDNGYGLGLINEENFEKIKKQKRYKVNGLEITGMTRIFGDWYYISFT